MRAPWLVGMNGGTFGSCGSCGAMLLTSVVYDQPTCPVCGATDQGLIDAMPDWEPCPGSGAAVGPWRDGSSMPCAYCPAVCVPAVATPWQLTLDDHLRRRMYNPIAFGQGTQIRDLWTNDVFEVVKHDSRTGMTELAAFGTGVVHLANSKNNARYVAVREEA